MINRFKTQVFLLMLWVMPSYCGSAELDFKKNIVCGLEYFQMCLHGDHSCRWGEVVDIDGKQTLIIDVDGKWVTLFEGENQIDKEPFDSLSTVNDVLYLHGTNPDSRLSKDGTGWVARIGKAQGDLSAATLADTKGYLIFGACRNQ